jgi:hypothetical protein
MRGFTHRATRRRVAGALAGLATLAVVAAALPSSAARQSSSATSNQGLWHLTSDSAFSRSGVKSEVNAKELQAFSLNEDNLAARLGEAPAPGSDDALVVSLPDPNGDFQRFAIRQSQIMAPGLAAKHPEISTFSGRGIDDPTATIHADLSPIGFHASVRSAQGAWYIDPYSHADQSVYASYYGRDVPKDPEGPFVERDAEAAELSVDHGYYHAADTVTVRGSAFAEDAAITITISDPEEHFAARTVNAQSDGLGSFEASFVADPDGNLDTHIVTASDGAGSASTSYQVVSDEDTTSDPPTGDVLRTYRTALITDPGYSAYFGGPANVTPAKVALMNRVSQVYEDDLSISLQLIANNDLLNLNTWDVATAPNGPCGAVACFTQSQVTGCSSTTRARFVIGQIIGASNYDLGHLALGQPGGGVANLGVVGRSNKAGGCTGIPTPVGDFYAIDYVAHEMGHQFAGNHPFNGNQLNCSGGNRNASTSVEPGSGSSIMAYAGICLTDDLQPHSDPYFSQRSLQEMSTYTSSNQAAINEVQTASLRHFGGGNEVQVATFGPGYSRTASIQPLTLNINAAPSATSRGGAEENGNTVTIATSAANTLQVGDTVTVAGVGVADYNGTWTVTAVPSTRSFQYTNPTAGLATSGGGTVTLALPGATEVGNTVTIRTSAAHGRSVGDVVTISGVGVGGYNGTFAITAVPSARSFEYTNPTAGLANSGGGTMTFFSPFQVRIGGNDSVVIGGSGLPYNTANVQTAINGIAGFAGTATVSNATATGFTVTYGGASAGLDVPNLELVNLSCGGCFASVEETNHGGAMDSFTLNFDGNVSAPIVNGVNYSAAGIQAALLPLLPAGGTVTVAGFGGGAFNNTGFQVTYTGTLAATNVPVTLALQDFTAGASGFVGETDKGGAVDNKGIVTPTGNAFPIVTAPASYTIPLRTPFALTGSATDADGDALTYSWEQNDRGGTAGTSLLNNTKTNGPLFAMFPISGQISESDTLLYNSPGENHVTGDPTRVLPDLQQILDNNTNADTGACTTGPIAPPVSIPVRECFMEFLPTADYVGFSGGGFNNSSPLSLHFRFTVRDGNGGVNAADTTLLLANTAGPFLVTSPNTAVTYEATSTQTVTWDVAGTDVAPIGTTDVKISLSLDGGHTYPYVLAASTPNDGSESVTLPYDGSAHARVKIEALGNIYFDISNADFTIHATPTVTNDAPGGVANVQYSDPMPPVTVSATDPDSLGSDLTATAAGLPAGAVLTSALVSGPTDDPGTHTWTVGGTITAAPGTYPVTVTVADETGATASTSFDVVVAHEDDIEIGYEGDEITFLPAKKHFEKVLLRATIQETDASIGDVRNATITFMEGTDTLCGPLPVSLQNGNTGNGVASCTVILGEGFHDVDIVVGGYYTGAEDQVVEVAEPDDTHISAAGETVMTNSAGIYRATNNTRMGFGLSVKYRDGKHDWRKKEDLSGHVDIVFKSGGKTYLAKSDDFDSLGVDFEKPGGGWCNGPTSSKCYGLADIRMEARLVDVTKWWKTSTVARHLSLRVTLTDRGSHGSKDSIGVTLWQGSKLLFSSKWNGTETVEQTLKSGKVYVR